MFEIFLRLFVLFLLKLRYKITVTGLKDFKKKGKTGILFMPNHPALIDPIIIFFTLFKKFRPRPLADKSQMERPGVSSLQSIIKPIILPDALETGRDAEIHALEAIDEVAEALNNGENVLFYPAGKIYRTPQEVIGGNRGLSWLLERVPDAQIALIRTKGLWGSSFSFGSGEYPSIAKHFNTYVRALIFNLLFFIPKRPVSIEVVEPDDFPIGEERKTINSYLETFYNKIPERNTHYPYFFWRGRKPIVLPENVSTATSFHMLDDVSDEIKIKVTNHLSEVTGITNITVDMQLSKDLGLDSLALMELLTWIEVEFGVTQDNPESFDTVASCILAAANKLQSSASIEKHEIDEEWFKPLPATRLSLGKGDNIAEMFLHKALEDPEFMIMADQIRGIVRYKDMITAIMVLKPVIEKIEGAYIGIMLPASATASIIYLSTVFAGKTPVLINWTVGKKQINQSLNLLGVKHILTAEALLSKLAKQGTDLSGMSVNLIKLEAVAKNIKLTHKLTALLKSRIAPKSLLKSKISETAAILFTSGSETVPKAVPLSHKNIITNITDATAVLNMKQNDILLAILPPFHSFGLSTNMITPLCLGLRTVYYPNPTEGAILADLIHQYKATALFGTPTFLNAVLRNGTQQRFASLRLFVTGAEKCPEHVYEKAQHLCPEAVICEGYGITECSPIVTVNPPDAPQIGSIGKLLSSIEHIIINPDTDKKVLPGEKGLLLVRGNNIFSGYLNYDGPSPFKTVYDKTWYNTGDLVREDENGYLLFSGRLKRFIKLGGEMISLPAIEQTLSHSFTKGEDAITLAVEATQDDTPQVILFTTDKMINRAKVNKAIISEGYSTLHTVKKVVHIDDIPLLGSGKTDYRSLKRLL